MMGYIFNFYIIPILCSLLLIAVLGIGIFYIRSYMIKQTVEERSSQREEMVVQIQDNLETGLENHWNLLSGKETSSTYVVANNEEPVVPEYDYVQVANTIAEIDEKIAIIKHALNVSNATAKIMVGDIEMSIDTILIRMAQLKKMHWMLCESVFLRPESNRVPICQEIQCRNTDTSIMTWI